MRREPWIAIVIHHPAETPDRFAAALARRGARIAEWRVFEAPVLPETDGYDGFLLMGGPQSARDDGFIAEERRWLAEEVLPRGVPVFGVCLGAQLVAHAAGGEIAPAPRRELGFFPVAATDAGRADPVFSALGDRPRTVFQWHGETWRLPAGAVRMATNPAVPEQGFRLGRAQYGVQFHPEVELATIRRWIEVGASERAALGEAGVRAMLAEAEHRLPAMHRLAEAMIEAWLAEVIEVQGLARRDGRA